MPGGPGELITVPHGVEHRPEALTGECNDRLPAVAHFKSSQTLVRAL
jgi:hypothetical protein